MAVFNFHLGFQLNKNRLTSVWFCSDTVTEFLIRNDLELIVRGHEVSKPATKIFCSVRRVIFEHFQLVDNGYEFTQDKKVLTIFSAPYYCDHPNDAAVLTVDDQLRCQIRVNVERTNYIKICLYTF